MSGLVALFLVCLGVIAPSAFAQQSDAPKIAELEKEIANLQSKYMASENKRIELQEKLIRAQTEQIKTDTDNLKRELKEDVSQWVLILLGAISLLAALGGGALIKLLVENQVSKQIAGEKAKFYDALNKIKAMQEQTEQTKDKLVEMNKAFVRTTLAGSMPTEQLAKHLPSETVFEILRESPKEEDLIRDSAIYTLGCQRYEPAIPYLIQSFDYEDNVALSTTIPALAHIGTPEAHKGLIQVCNSLIDLPASERRNTVLHRVMAHLAEMKKPEGIPVLKKVLLQKEPLHQSDWMAAISAIADIGGDKATGALKDMIKETDKVAVKTHCLQVLERKLIGIPAIVPELITALSDEDKKVRVYAVHALGEMGEPAKKSVPSLIRAFDDKEGDVRVAAVEALTQMGEEAMPELIDALDSGNEQIRGNAAQVLRKIDTPEANKVLEEYEKQRKTV